MNVLVIDVGGSHVKLLAGGQREPRRFDSGPDLTPQQMVDGVRRTVGDWSYDAVSLGYPGKVDRDGPAEEPGNLGCGWVGFDYAKALGRPVRIVNDAALQALGGYDGGRMLFLGLGTGLGSTLVTQRVVVPLELGCLAWGGDGQTLFDLLSKDRLARDGEAAWLATVRAVIPVLAEAMAVDYMVLGGGNAGRVDPLPPNVRRGPADAAFAGGFRMWEEPVDLHGQQPKNEWQVVG